MNSEIIGEVDETMEDIPGAAPVAPPQMAQAPRPFRPVVVPGQTGYPGFDASIIAERQARERSRDSDLAALMFENTRIEDAQKAVEVALRFQALRSFGREVETGISSGLDPEKAAARAAALHPTALGGGSGAASFIQGLAKPRAQVFNFPGGNVPAVVSGNRVAFPPASSFPIDTKLKTQTVGGENYVVGARGSWGRQPTPLRDAQVAILKTKINQVNQAILDLPPSSKSAFAEKRKQLEATLVNLDNELRDMLTPAAPAVAAPASVRAPVAPPAAVRPMAPPVARPPVAPAPAMTPAPVVPPPPPPPAATNAPAAKPGPANVPVGTVYKGYRYNGKYPPGDKRAWDKV